MRVLITGSRHVSHDEAAMIWAHLDDWYEKTQRPMILVHGHCPTGVDHVAHLWATDRKAAGWDIEVEPHPADWNGPYKKGAGNVRNSHMVDLGADMCLGYPGVDSTGTWDCLKKALGARIPIYVIGLIDESRDH